MDGAAGGEGLPVVLFSVTALPSGIPNAHRQIVASQGS